MDMKTQIQTWIDNNEWNNIIEYITDKQTDKQDEKADDYAKQFIDVFLYNDKNIDLDRVKQFVAICETYVTPSVVAPVADLFTQESDFFYRAIEQSKIHPSMDVLKYILTLRPIDDLAIVLLIRAGARFAALVPIVHLDAFLDDDSNSIDMVEGDPIDLSGMLYCAQVCSIPYVRARILNDYNHLVLQRVLSRKYYHHS
jgi:hypothetical protein